MAVALAELHAMLRQGIAALEGGDLALAEMVFRAAVERHPRAHEAWNLLSVVAVRSGQPEVSAACARKALELDRRNAIYQNNLGIACGELGLLDDAEAAFRRALKTQPVYPQALYNLGKVLHKLNRVDEAVRAYERAHAMAPNEPGLRRNLAQLYQQRGQPERALAMLEEMGGPPDEAHASTYAACLADAKGDAAAIAWLSRLVEQRPEWSTLRFERGARYLGLGRWLEGWDDYLSRPGIPRGERAAHLPERLEEASVLLMAEQGLGDTLFFLRFAPLLRKRGARTTLHCPPKLLDLLRGHAVVDEVIDEREPPGRFDYTVWVGDLPWLLGSITAEPPVPVRGREVGQEKLRAIGPAPYLALTWRAGSDVHQGPEFGRAHAALSKEVPLEALAAAVRGWPGTLVSVQRNPLPGETERLGELAGARVHDLSALNDDLVAMTGVLAAIEEYVAVSNTNIHLRAGVGKAARVLVPQPPEWRWMAAGERSPWFPDMPVYRQAISRDWSQALARLRRNLMP